MTSYNAESCPGIKKFLRPKPECFPCSHCGGSVEIWSDEDTGICDVCGKEVGRPEKEPSCLDWCQYADKCREIIRRKKH
ncbi:MAG TPA: phosphohydrolase [Candidatus Bathyarchaeota archaeon]|nr:phosphohydrolase [Candidatus Bathyarchaeota archaeon]